MLGAALRLDGWRVRVLVGARSNVRSERYFRSFGIDEFVYLDSYRLSAIEERRCATAAAELLSGPMTFPVVKGWTFEGGWVGPQILSALSRASHDGAPDPAESGTHAAFTRRLPALLERILIARHLMDNVKPDLGLTIEANDAVYGPFVDQAIVSGTPVIQVTQPWRDDALTMRRLTVKTRRMHPSSVSTETLDALATRDLSNAEQLAIDTMFANRYDGKWFLQSRNQPQTRSFDRAALVERLGLRADRKIAVVFSHVLWDANLFYGEDLFRDYGDWFVETVRAATRNTELDWIIKLHPANIWKRAREQVDGGYTETRLIEEQIGNLPAHVHVLAADSDINSLSLFEHADYGVTVRGTVGMEMPCFGKPMLTAGTGRYSGLGFTLDSASPDEYLARLAYLHETPRLSAEQTIRARWHAYAALIMRPWRMQSFKSAFNYQKKGLHPLDQNLSPLAFNMNKVDANGDLHRFATWAAGKDVDYLESNPDADGAVGAQ
jgi:hypothetical protein